MALDYLPSPGWAVIYGETPSATRWSELGDNDDALATGAGWDDDIVDSRHYVAGSIDGEHLSTNAIIIGYASTTTSQGGLVNSETALTSMTITVNVPAGGRKVRLAFAFPNFNSTGGTDDQCRVFFKENTTYLSSSTKAPANVFGSLFNGEYIFTPSAGSHTYFLTYQRTNGTGTGATNAAADAVCIFYAELK